MNEISPGDDSDTEPISTNMIKDICDDIQSHPSINRREAYSRISDCIRRGQEERTGELKARQNMGKGLHKVFKSVFNEISKIYQLWVNRDQPFLNSFKNL